MFDVLAGVRTDAEDDVVFDEGGENGEYDEDGVGPYAEWRHVVLLCDTHDALRMGVGMEVGSGEREDSGGS